MYPLIALALFDDAGRTNDVLPKLQKYGPWAVEASKICKMGAHERRLLRVQCPEGKGGPQVVESRAV